MNSEIARSRVINTYLYRIKDGYDCGNQLALYNKKYDRKLLRESKDIHFNQAYIDDFFKEDTDKKNKVIGNRKCFENNVCECTYAILLL